MKKLLTLLLALFCVAGVWAEDVTEEQALEQALEFLTNTPATPGSPRHTSSGTPQLVAAKKVSGLYVFNIKNNGGFVIVSNDDRTRPILGYSDRGNVNPSEMPDNMKAWLQGYADEIAWLQKQNTKVARPKKARNKVGSHNTTAITPMLTSQWYQDAPYNNLCPTLYGNTKCATGCVATAMAQVMYYHKWPESNTKTIPGYTTYTQGFNLSSLSPVTFQWNNMIDNYNGNYTTAQGNAVATLMKYCGYSVQMDYSDASGAYTEDIPYALKTYFDYNATTKFISRSSYSYAKWTDLIYHELSEGRPVIYGGLSTGGGHEFVCDGYKYQNNTDFFHINWGWGGMSDNYFVLSALDPDQQGIGGSSSTDGFHYGQDAVIGIQKPSDSGTTADITPQDYNLVLNSTTLSNNPVSPNSTISITFNVTNNGSEEYDGDLWIDIIDYEGDEYLYDLNSCFIPAGTTQDCVFSFQPSAEGTYIIKFCYIDANGEYTVVDENAATLTVVQNVTSKYVPIYGYYCDEYSRSQFIIPAANIEDMINSEVKGVTFYAEESSVAWDAAKFDVYLSKTNDNTLSSLKDWNSLEKVYSGSLSVVNNKMAITFDTPIYYDGGNLLVGINQTTKGDYESVSWIGEKVTGVSLGGYNTSISQQNFLPQTTFDYTPGLPPSVSKPTNVTVSYTGGTEAMVSWVSDAPAFDIEVNGTVTENVSNPTTLTGLELATTYIIKVRAKNGSEVSDWTSPVNFTTDLSDDMCQIQLVLIDQWGDGWNGATIAIADVTTGAIIGTYTNKDLNGTYNNGENEANTFYVEVPNDRDISFTWTSGKYDSECSYTAYDVNGEEIFSGSGAMNDPVTYHVNCNALPKPANLAAEASTTQATLSWESDADSYVLRYRTAAQEMNLNVWNQVGSDVTTTGKLETYTFDLSAFSGTGYIAIRHYNVSDMFYLNIDDIVVKNAEGTIVLSEDFEDGSAPESWENIDLDGDGYDWILREENDNDSNGNPYYNGTYAISSASFINDLGPLTPDNWLIIPNIELGGTLTLVARGQDPSYAAEVFGVYVATESYQGFPAGEWVEVATDETSCQIDDLTPNTVYEWEVKGVQGTNESNWASSTFTTMEAAPFVVLANNEDNTSLIESLDGEEGYDVQLADRTLYKDGSWNTLCLPFDVTIAGSVLDGADVRALNNVTLEGETVMLNFTAEGQVTELLAGTPYIIKWENSDNIVNPVFTDVTIDKTMNDATFDIDSDKSITFKGTYSFTTFSETNKSILFLGNSDKLYYPLSGARIGAQRAYFQLTGITPSDKVKDVKQYVLSFGDDADGISNLSGLSDASEDWYSLDGKKLAGKPSQKGVYIVNGNKTIIK
ncbi:MAG: C10 family peptidase [Bacteroidaceae bacterium]|nr:C10 family peptidase [Bacteroidaceae bacterium]